MPLRNRVLPTGEIVAHPARGLFMGNRGCLHDRERRLVRQTGRQRFWITCLTSFKDRRRAVMTPGRYTELFFLDEAVALAAGHRPCAECRRADYDAFRRRFAQSHGVPLPSAPALDDRLHADRRDEAGAQRTYAVRLSDAPHGSFIGEGDAILLVAHGLLHPFAPEGYGAPIPMGPDRPVTMLTPRCTVAVLAAGYAPLLHPTVQSPT